jgi:hypothetical protein
MHARQCALGRVSTDQSAGTEDVRGTAGDRRDANTLKFQDVTRDPRFSLHTATIDAHVQEFADFYAADLRVLPPWRSTAATSVSRSGSQASWNAWCGSADWASRISVLDPPGSEPTPSLVDPIPNPVHRPPCGTPWHSRGNPGKGFPRGSAIRRPVLLPVLISSHWPIAARFVAVGYHKSRTNRKDRSISCIEPGPTIPCREVSRSTETTRN